MIIAELFVNLGIKGAEKTVGALTGIEKSLKGLGSMSLEAKAAIIGAMYALERLFSRSGQAGTDLTNFNVLLGGTTKTLQQYQYAARQVGVSNQETENTFKALQSTMTKLRMGEGAPKGYAQVAMLTGGITAQDVDKFMQNPELLLQKLQQYAQKEKRIGIRNEVLKSFGISDNMVAALSRNAFTNATLQRAPTYSEKEIAALDKANIAWSNLGNKIEMAIGHFNALHGGELVKDFTLLTDKVLQLTSAFLKLATTIHLFEGIGKAFEGLSMLFGGVTYAGKNLQTSKGRESIKNDAEDFFRDIPAMIKLLIPSFFDPLLKSLEPQKNDDNKSSSKQSTTPQIKVKQSDNIINFFHKDPGIFKSITDDLFGKTPGSKIPETAVVKEPQTTVIPSKETTIINNVTEPTHFSPVIQPGKESTTLKNSKETNNTKTIINPGKEPRSAEKPNIRLVVPPSPIQNNPSKPNIYPKQESGNSTTQNFNVNQSFSFASDGKDRHQVADTMKKAVTQAFRQMSSQIQGS